MPAPKGRPKPKGSGIKKGQKQTKTLQWQEWGQALIDDNMPYLERKLNQLQKEDDFEAWSVHFYRLLEYFKPKMQRNEIEANIQRPVTAKDLVDELKARRTVVNNE